MREGRIEVANEHGLHLRVAAAVVRLIQRHGVRAKFFSKNNRAADGTSVLEMLALDASPGTEVRVQVDGPGEDQAFRDLTELFTDGGGI